MIGYMAEMYALPATEPELDEFLRGFEAGTYPKEKWTHGAHVMAGAAYLHALGEAEALITMRRNVRAYNEAVGGKNTDDSGYHETLTRFWIEALAGLRRRMPEASRLAFAEAAVERWGRSSGWFRQFYDFDVVASREARREWVAPARPALVE